MANNLEKMTGLLYDSIVEKLYPLGDHVLPIRLTALAACGASVEIALYYHRL